MSQVIVTDSAAPSSRLSLGLAVLRVVVGIVFAVHGYQKLFVQTVPGVTGFFTQINAPLPGITAPLVSVLEFVGGIMLGLGRALGETLAVTFVIGNANRVATSLFGPGNTIASLVALEFGEAGPGSLKLSSLLALGFILFILTFIVLAISRLLLRPRARAS